MLKKIVNKNLFYNFLSLFNIIIAFIFTILIGRILGIGEETDIYFSSISIITIIGTLVKATWEAFSPDFIKLKIENKNAADELYSILLNNIVIISIFLIILYYTISINFNIMNKELKDFLDLFIFYLLMQNILYYNKVVLNLEHYYGLYYIIDILIYSISLMLIFLIKVSLFDIGIIFLITTFFAITVQFFVIFQKLNYKYIFKFSNKLTKSILINSFKYRSGTFIYSLKDFLILYFFNNLGTGYYTLFSYANKFAMTISQIVNAPIINIFITKLNYKVGEKNYSSINNLIKNVLIQTLPLFLFVSVIIYLILPFMLKILLNVTTETEISDILNMFLILIFFNFIIVIETPFVRSLIIFKEFNFCLYTNIVFIILFTITFLINYNYMDSYNYILYSLVLVQITNTVLYFYKFTKYLKKLDEK